MASIQPQPFLCDYSASWIVYSCHGGPAVQNESPALQPPESVEVIYCNFLLPITGAYSLAAKDHPTCPPSAMLVGLADPASIKKAMSNAAEKQLLHDDTKKVERRKQDFRNGQIGR